MTDRMALRSHSRKKGRPALTHLGTPTASNWIEPDFWQASGRWAAGSLGRPLPEHTRRWPGKGDSRQRDARSAERSCVPFGQQRSATRRQRFMQGTPTGRFAVQSPWVWQNVRLCWTRRLSGCRSHWTVSRLRLVRSSRPDQQTPNGYVNR